MDTKLNPFAQTREQYIINLVNPSANQRILCVGISNIPTLEMDLENKVKECWTIDIDKRKLERAASYLKKTELVHADITKENNLKKGYFDTIIILEVLEHLDDDAKTLAWARSLLKLGGKIIISVPNKNPIHIFNPLLYTEHKRHYSNKNILTLVKNSGFDIEHFNVVESWLLLVNLYVHLFNKFFLHKNVPFGEFTKMANCTYLNLNRKGLDIIVVGVKMGSDLYNEKNSLFSA